MNIGSKIASMRTERNISQSKLAEKLNVTRQAVSNWERNKSEPDTESLKNIAEYFGVEINAFFYDTAVIKVSRSKKLKVLLTLNIILLIAHIASIFFGYSNVFTIMITPALITFIILIMHFVFVSSSQNGDYSIIAGYNKLEDDDAKVQKQLYYIELLIQIIGVLCNTLFFLTYPLGDKNAMPVSLIISGVFTLGLAIVMLVVNKKIDTKKK